ncbi:MAG: hypothetical protein JWR60_1145 [Polaromonas sp.]|nr:hypothetical protein [Polaromonas sp.]
MTPVHVRLAALADVDAIAPLFDAHRQFYAQPADLALAAAFIKERLRNHESLILLATAEDGRMLGFCQLYPSFCSVEARPIYTLYDLFVIPAARRTGAARRLLQAAEQQAARADIARMDLTTARTNLSAQSLYASCGWQRDDVFHAYSRRVEGGAPG